jgi:hypothetical protein
LSQYAKKEVFANIAFMGIGNCDGYVTFDHELMFAAGVRPIEAQLPQ